MSGDQCRIDGRDSAILAHYRQVKAEEWASGWLEGVNPSDPPGVEKSHFATEEKKEE